MTERKNNGRGFGGKGYYIALILCAVAIGISGYLYYQNANQDTLNVPDSTDGVQADATGEANGDIPVNATQPDSLSDGSQPTQGREQTVLQTGSPVEGETIAPYAMDCLSYNATTRDWRVHNGVDIAAEAGTPVLAAADGTVYTTYEDDTMGCTVVIRHEGGYTTTYSSLAPELAVQAGDEVKLGDVIGCVGSSALLENAIGDHVHFSVLCNDEVMDPAEFLTLGQ